MPLIAISEECFDKLGDYYGEDEDIETALWRLIKEYDKNIGSD